MNERILELARESHIDVYGLGKDRVKWEATLEAFAKLILEDIDKIIDVAYISYPLQQAVVCLDIDFLIKEHFYSKSTLPCKSPYCEYDTGKYTHPGFHDARG